MRDPQYEHIISLTERILRNQKLIQSATDAEARKALDDQPKLMNKLSAANDKIKELEDLLASSNTELQKAQNHVTVLRDARNKAEQEASEMKLKMKQVKESLNV